MVGTIIGIIKFFYKIDNCIRFDQNKCVGFVSLVGSLATSRLNKLHIT